MDLQLHRAICLAILGHETLDKHSRKLGVKSRLGCLPSITDPYKSICPVLNHVCVFPIFEDQPVSDDLLAQMERPIYYTEIDFRGVREFEERLKRWKK